MIPPRGDGRRERLHAGRVAQGGPPRPGPPGQGAARGRQAVPDPLAQRGLDRRGLRRRARRGRGRELAGPLHDVRRPCGKLANTGQLDFVDMHLSHVSQMVLEGFLGRIDFAIVEATEITPDGKVYLTTGIGNAPTFLQKADKVIIELNACHSPRLREMADIIVLPPAAAPPADPDPRPAGQDRQAVRRVDPAKVVGVVHNDEPDGGRGFAPPDDVSRRIAAHVSRFLLDEMAAGRIPRRVPPAPERRGQRLQRRGRRPGRRARTSPSSRSSPRSSRTRCST